VLSNYQIRYDAEKNLRSENTVVSTDHVRVDGKLLYSVTLVYKIVLAKMSGNWDIYIFLITQRNE
jgi:hypothetical protein